MVCPITQGDHKNQTTNNNTNKFSIILVPNERYMRTSGHRTVDVS